MIAGRRFRWVASLYGSILKWFAMGFAVPLLMALAQGTAYQPFLVPLLLTGLLGWVLERRYSKLELEISDGFLLVAITWITVALFGTLPYVLSGIGSLAHPVNALFESTSGFTATGSTAMVEISLDKYPHALMFWRQFTQWLGGMGVVVLAVAILPRLSVGGAQFLNSEVPGPSMEQLTPHIAETARRLWLLYIGLSVALFLVLIGLHYGNLAPRMDAFQALAHVFTSISCAGFSPQAGSIGAFSPVVQWVIFGFIVTSAMNFALLWRTIFQGPGRWLEDTEVKVYLAIVLLSGVFLSILLWTHGQYETLEETVRHGFFQGLTIIFQPLISLCVA
jgi:trk system potassium uptake protein TrkH